MFRAFLQRLERSSDHPPDEQPAQESPSSACASASYKRDLATLLSQLRIGLGQRKVRVEHAQDLLAAGCAWQSALEQVGWFSIGVMIPSTRWPPPVR